VELNLYIILHTKKTNKENEYENMYKMVFRYFLIFRKLEIGRGRVETGRRSSHSPLALIRAKLRPQSGGPDVDGVSVVDRGVGVECRASLRLVIHQKLTSFTLFPILLIGIVTFCYKR
jgi:hypothetical protein